MLRLFETTHAAMHIFCAFFPLAQIDKNLNFYQSDETAINEILGPERMFKIVKLTVFWAHILTLEKCPGFIQYYDLIPCYLQVLQFATSNMIKMAIYQPKRSKIKKMKTLCCLKLNS